MTYISMLNTYEQLTESNLCTKHHTYDSVFFIVDEGSKGYKVVKFYFNSNDYRVSGYYDAAYVAYSEAFLWM